MKITEIKHNGLIWRNIVKPDQAVLEKLRDKYKFHSLDLEDCLSNIQRPKIDEYPNYLFLIFHFPYYDKSAGNITLYEMYAFIGNGYVITLGDGNSLFQNIFNEVRSRKKLQDDYMKDNSGYILYNILDEMFTRCFPLIDRLNDQVDEIEGDVFKMENPKDMLKDILFFKKDIINFRRIIFSQRELMHDLKSKVKDFMPKSLEVYFDDTVDKVEKLYANVETLKEMAESLHETNDAILTHSTNNIIKILTIFSVIMMPLTFVTGLYGMNIVGLPIAQHPLSFLLISIGLIGIVLLMLAFFKYKKWI
ncbi:magnesium transporter CorA family protein [Patescibacteria group bacterium]|nr:magnesium transporter CorA family protein [Patescibacteria group bacterium]